jgi:hypothetical protein
MTPADCRIDIRRRTARWDPAAEVSAAEAMDFWAFAAGAANVVCNCRGRKWATASSRARWIPEIC